MCDRRWAAAAVLLVISFVGRLPAQESTPRLDPSPHTVQFVTVDKDVKLEVLDWGGSGRPLVLLDGLGNTAHVFDDFAPKLTSQYHVYGITRRGFGASSSPDTGYSADRLGDDVLAVLDALKLDHPVLVGHSIAGEELSSIGSRHPERVAGLVYLDAGYSYAYYDRTLGDLNLDSLDFEKKEDEFEAGVEPSDMKRLAQELQLDLPKLANDIREMQKNLEVLPSEPPEPTDADRASFPAWSSWQERTVGNRTPEAEWREIFTATSDGRVGKPHANPSTRGAIRRGQNEYTSIRAPVLVIFAVPHDLGPYFSTNNRRSAFEAWDESYSGAQAKAFGAGIPSARVVQLPRANHFVFMSNEADVLREMRAFIERLPMWPGTVTDNLRLPGVGFISFHAVVSLGTFPNPTGTA